MPTNTIYLPDNVLCGGYIPLSSIKVVKRALKRNLTIMAKQMSLLWGPALALQPSAMSYRENQCNIFFGFTELFFIQIIH